MTLQRPVIKAIEWLAPDGFDSLLTAELDRETVDFAHLIGKNIEIDGRVYRCLGVSRHAHAPPFRPPETLLLRIRSVLDDPEGTPPILV